MLSDTTMVTLAYCAAPCDLHFRILGRGNGREVGDIPAFSNYGVLSKVNGICYVTRDYMIDRWTRHSKSHSSVRRITRLPTFSTIACQLDKWSVMSMSFLRMFNTPKTNMSFNIKTTSNFGSLLSLLIVIYGKPTLGFRYNPFSQEEI